MTPPNRNPSREEDMSKPMNELKDFILDWKTRGGSVEEIELFVQAEIERAKIDGALSELDYIRSHFGKVGINEFNVSIRQGELKARKERI